MRRGVLVSHGSAGREGGREGGRERRWREGREKGGRVTLDSGVNYYGN